MMVRARMGLFAYWQYGVHRLLDGTHDGAGNRVRRDESRQRLDFTVALLRRP
jgi:hypothetical protein